MNQALIFSKSWSGKKKHTKLFFIFINLPSWGKDACNFGFSSHVAGLLYGRMHPHHVVVLQRLDVLIPVLQDGVGAAMWH